MEKMQTEISHYVRDESYKQVLKRSHTDVQRNVIYHIIHSHSEGITDLEICILTGFSRSSVTARRNELVGVKAVGIAKIHDDMLGDRLNTLWGVVDVR